jgi:hypothetical protein
MRNKSSFVMFRSRPLVTTGLLACAVVVFAVSCGGDEADPEESVRAPSPPPSEIEAWLEASPWRAHMRAMWIDCANVLHFANDPTLAHLDSIECAGEDLARKAERYASFWTQVEEAVGETAAAARDGAWPEAARRYGRIWKACCDCHVEAWPLELRSYTPTILRTWVEGVRVTAEVEWGDLYERRLAARPSNPLREHMRRLNELTLRMADHIDSREGVPVAEAATLIATLAEESGELWWGIHDRGRAIQAAAEEGRVRVLKPLYRALREQCVRCHAMSLIGTRPLLDPPAWK